MASNWFIFVPADILIVYFLIVFSTVKINILFLSHKQIVEDNAL